MKNLLLLMSLVLLSLAGLGQDKIPAFSEQNTATIDANFCVTLDSSEPVARYYVIDIAALNIANESDAWVKFGYIADNLLTYHVFFDQQKVTLEIHLDRLQNKEDLNWWNAYLQNKCDK